MTQVADTAFRVEHEIRIEASPDEVFRLLSEPTEVARWMPVTVFEPRLGGEFEMRAGDHVAFGEITALEPPRRIAYTWDWRNKPIGARTEVTWDVEADGDASLVRLTHVGLPMAEHAESHSHGWDHYEQRLRMVAEGGDPGEDTMGRGDAEA
jgi:uncharacterized protein YndB with AHSA1/START domain